MINKDMNEMSPVPSYVDLVRLAEKMGKTLELDEKQVEALNEFVHCQSLVGSWISIRAFIDTMEDAIKESQEQNEGPFNLSTYMNMHRKNATVQEEESRERCSGAIINFMSTIITEKKDAST